MAQRYFEGVSHAKLYLSFRPRPPSSLVPRILDFLREKYTGELDYMLDIGCGSGQSTALFAQHFKRIQGTDASSSQIKFAEETNAFDNITFRSCPAESIPADAGEVQLVTSSQAAHWFDHVKFYAEVDRVLVPHGVIAMHGYKIPRLQHKTDPKKTEQMCRIFDDFYTNELTRKYWGEGIIHTENEYENMPIPYEDYKRITSTELFSDADTTMEQFLGYVTSWSGFQKYKDINGNEAAERILNDLGKSLCEILETTKPYNEVEFQVRYPYFMIIGRKPGP